MEDKLKKTLVIIHGWDGSIKSWSGFIELAKPDYNIHFVELPCFDNIPCPNEIWGVKEYADYVYKEIENLNLKEKPVILGHSFGGQIATYLISQHDKLVSHLILCGAAIVRPKHTFKKILLSPLVLISKIFKYIPGFSILRRHTHKVFGMHDYSESTGIKREIFKKIIREDLTHLLAHIKLPTLVLWGKYDTYTPLRHGISIAKKISNSTMHIHNDGKHGLHIKQPEWLLENIKEFLKK
jgi:pimeloyl-ACP methyl ester carboxylesterase